MFARLAPSSCRRPWPSEGRRSISAASFGWLVTIARPWSFSHQRKAGMSSSFPCSRPAWQAPVCEDQSVSQPSSRKPWSCTERASAGALPSRIARWSTSWASPSISSSSRPGTSVSIASLERLSWRRTMWRYQRSPRSSANRPPTIVVISVRPTITTTAENRSLTWTSSRTAAESSSSAPLRISAPRPSVATVNGSAMRNRSGQTSELARPRMTASPKAATKPSSVNPDRISLSPSRASASRSRTKTRRPSRRNGKRASAGGDGRLLHGFPASRGLGRYGGHLHDRAVAQRGDDPAHDRGEDVQPRVGPRAGGERGPEPARGIEARTGRGPEDQHAERQRAADRGSGDALRGRRVHGGAHHGPHDQERADRLGQERQADASALQVAIADPRRAVVDQRATPEEERLREQRAGDTAERLHEDVHPRVAAG